MLIRSLVFILCKRHQCWMCLQYDWSGFYAIWDIMITSSNVRNTDDSALTSKHASKHTICRCGWHMLFDVKVNSYERRFNSFVNFVLIKCDQHKQSFFRWTSTNTIVKRLTWILKFFVSYIFTEKKIFEKRYSISVEYCISFINENI